MVRRNLIYREIVAKFFCFFFKLVFVFVLTLNSLIAILFVYNLLLLVVLFALNDKNNMFLYFGAVFNMFWIKQT